MLQEKWMVKMQKFIIGKKLGMTQIINEDGIVVPVTVIHAEPCVVLDKKQKDVHGYDALVVGYQEKDEKKCNKPLLGIYKKLKVQPKKMMKEFRVLDSAKFEINQTINVDIFSKNDKVKVKGRSIGKGFAGTIKRHNFRRGPKSHGSKNYRLPGSIGGGTTPGRVIKGKKMPGHLGNANVVIKNLTIAQVNNEQNYIFIKGAVPGKKNSIITIYN
jgi:large subunit ribosomal protein L3